MRINPAATIIAASLAALLLAVATLPRSGVAGLIRKMYLTEDKPGVVTLAFGQSTALSFFSKPEKVVPGSPQKLQIDFLGKDLTITPLGINPGNLLVYTKSGRYVILLKLGTASSYDDVVQIEPGIARRGARPLRLLEDSFHIESVEAKFQPKSTSDQAPFLRRTTVSVSTDGKRMEVEGLNGISADMGTFQCEDCRVSHTRGVDRILCQAIIHSLKCHTTNGLLTLRRTSP